MSCSSARPVEVKSIHRAGHFHYAREPGWTISDDEVGDEWAGGEFSERVCDELGDYLILGSVQLFVLSISNADVLSTISDEILF
jgi:hypothetical protein